MKQKTITRLISLFVLIGLPGGGGAPQYTLASGQLNIVVTSESYSFGEFTISGNTLTSRVVNDSGATIDTYTITK